VAGKTILVVDADVASRNFVVRTLQQQQYNVLQVGSGKEGLIEAWRNLPDLIIIDPSLPDLGGEELAFKLRQDPRTNKLPLVALSADKTATRLRSCLDAGFNEFIVKSGEAVPVLIEALEQLLGVTSAKARQGGLLIAFLSAKGGVGTSSLCANLAMNIAHNQPELKVVVVDTVLPLGSIAPIVGYEGGQNLATVADLDPAKSTAEFFRENLMKLADWSFYLLASAPDPESANHLQAGRVREIVNELKLGYDYVILDLGRSLSKFNLSLLQEADLVVLVIGTDTGSVTLTKTVLDYLHSKGVANSYVYAIMNRAIGLEGVSKPDAEKILGLEIQAAIPYLGNHLATANDQHHPFSLKFPKETATIVLREIAQQMTEMARRLRSS
jgi:pilus assembly protein CpaE